MEEAELLCVFATSNSTTGIAIGDVETLDPKIASGLFENPHVDFRKRVFNEEGTRTVLGWETHRKDDLRAIQDPATRAVQFWTFWTFGANRTQGDNVQTFDAKWDETIVAT